MAAGSEVVVQSHLQMGYQMQDVRRFFHHGWCS